MKIISIHTSTIQRPVGAFDGDAEGALEGAPEGYSEGAADGNANGATDGTAEGALVGLLEGSFVGVSVKLEDTMSPKNLFQKLSSSVASFTCAS